MAIAARGEAALANAAELLRSAGGDVLHVSSDITSQEQVDRLFAETVNRFGRIDGLVNCAGISMRGAILDAAPEDFQRLIELNLIGVVRCIRAAAQQIVLNRGHIVNISSLAGKSASRYLGAYPASKFALTAYNQQLRLELGPLGVHVMLVCPGPIAREKPRTYGAETMADLPTSAARPGGGVRTRALDPKMLADRIVRSCQRRRAELIVPRHARLLFALTQLSPALGDFILRRFT